MTPESIVELVAEAHGLALERLLGPSRARRVTGARFEAMLLVREAWPGLSLVDIGRMFSRDHSSVVHGLGRIRQLERRCAVTRQRLDALRFRAGIAQTTEEDGDA